MSLHVHHHECRRRDTDAGREVLWVSWCDCGWQGGEWSLSAYGEAAERARLDYRQHIEETLGAEGYYTASVGCRNCGSHHEQGVLVGTHVSSASCASCGTRMLQPDNEVWDESREAGRRYRFW